MICLICQRWLHQYIDHHCPGFPSLTPEQYNIIFDICSKAGNPYRAEEAKRKMISAAPSDINHHSNIVAVLDGYNTSLNKYSHDVAKDINTLIGWK